jgi:hypothetical protein
VKAKSLDRDQRCRLARVRASTLKSAMIGHRAFQTAQRNQAILRETFSTRAIIVALYRFVDRILTLVIGGLVFWQVVDRKALNAD